jgi:CRISPR-associated protein Cmr4
MANDWACLFLHCITPLHNGAGQGLGTIDRPILRERTTNYPIVQADTLKGALKAMAENEDWDGTSELEPAFGKGETGGNQGALIFKEASLLAFPVRSLAGTFAWVTSRLILARLCRWLKEAGLEAQPLATRAQALLGATNSLDSNPQHALGPQRAEAGADPAFDDSAVRLAANGPYVLEGLVLQAVNDVTQRKALADFAATLAELLFGRADAVWAPFFRQRLLLLPHAPFDHLIQTATEVRPNIQIGEKGVTTDGSLRYTEFLPAETLLLSFVHLEETMLCATADKDGLWSKCAALMNRSFQLGADESKGKGIVQGHFWTAATVGGAVSDTAAPPEEVHHASK